MDPSLLQQIFSRLDNDSLQLLSQTSAWHSIREVAEDQDFWRLRVETLLGVHLRARSGEDWKRAYYILEPTINLVNPFTDGVLASPLATSILIEAGNDPSANNNFAIKRASWQGYADTVRLLLRDRRVDPSADRDTAIKQAAWRGHIEVVRLLLGDSRVDPAVDDNYAVKNAYENGYMDVVELLVRDPRVTFNE